VCTTIRAPRRGHLRETSTRLAATRSLLTQSAAPTLVPSVAMTTVESREVTPRAEIPAFMAAAAAAAAENPMAAEVAAMQVVGITDAKLWRS
jgi:hypothetical protein